MSNCSESFADWIDIFDRVEEYLSSESLQPSFYYVCQYVLDDHLSFLMPSNNEIIDLFV